MANPYLNDGVGQGLQTGLAVMRQLNDLDRQKMLDQQRAEDRVTEQQLRGLQMRKGEMDIANAEREQALQVPIEVAKAREVEDRQNVLADRTRKEQVHQSAIDTDKIQRDKYRQDIANSRLEAKSFQTKLDTEEKRKKFGEAWTTMAAWEAAPPDQKEALMQVGAMAKGKLNPKDVNPQILNEAFKVMFEPEMNERLDTVYDVDDLDDNGYNLSSGAKQALRGKDLKARVIDVKNPKVSYDPETKRMIATTDQTLEITGPAGYEKFTIDIKGAPATKDKSAKKDSKLSTFTLEEITKRLDTMNGLPALYKELEARGIPPNQIKAYVASQSALLDMKPPQGLGITPKPTLTAEDQKSAADAAKKAEEARALKNQNDRYEADEAGLMAQGAKPTKKGVSRTAEEQAIMDRVNKELGIE